MLEINSTVLIQILNFLILLIILNIFLFKPIRNILIERNEETESLGKSIEDFKNQSAEKEKGIEESMIEARKEGFLEKEGFKAQGLEKEKGILQEAGLTVENKIGATKKEMEVKSLEVRKALEEQLSAFSNELAEKILGRSI